MPSHQGFEALRYDQHINSGNPILIGNPGLYPGADTKNPDLTNGLHADDQLGSGAILHTDAGRDNVKEALATTVRVASPDFLTTPTWSTRRRILARVGLESLAHDITAKGVQLTYEAIKESEGHNVAVLGSIRPIGDSETNDGAPSDTAKERDATRREYHDDIAALIDGADGRPMVVGLETSPNIIEAEIFADLCENEFEVPYAVSFRPTDSGLILPDDTTFDRIPDAINGSRLVAAGFICQWANTITSALVEADRLGVKITWAGPNGFNDSPGHEGGSPGTLDRNETHQATLDELTLWRELGVVIFDGCCGTIASELADYRERLVAGDILDKAA